MCSWAQLKLSRSQVTLDNFRGTGVSALGKTNSNRLTTWARLLLLLLIWVAFARVMWQLDAKNLWWDESLSLQRAESNWLDLILGRLYLYDGLTRDLTHDQHPFFFFILQGILLRLAGESEIVLRFPSVMAATLLVPAVWSIARFFVRHATMAASTPMWAALLAALHPYYLWYGQEARPYALWATLAILSTYCLARATMDSARHLSLSRHSEPEAKNLSAAVADAEAAEERDSDPYRTGGMTNPRTLSPRRGLSAAVPESREMLSVVKHDSSDDMRGWWIGFAISALMFYTTHFYAVFLLPVHALILALWLWARSRRVALVAMGGALLAGAAVGAFAYWSIIVRQGGGRNFPEVEPAILFPDLLNAFSLGLSVDITRVWQ
jgi:hypothetical protein